RARGHGPVTGAIVAELAAPDTAAVRARRCERGRAGTLRDDSQPVQRVVLIRLDCRLPPRCDGLLPGAPGIAAGALLRTARAIGVVQRQQAPRRDPGVLEEAVPGVALRDPALERQRGG